MKKLEGKVALISGSGRGIGREIALKLARDGARIVVNDLDAAPAEETVAAIVAFAAAGKKELSGKQRDLIAKANANVELLSDDIGHYKIDDDFDLDVRIVT